MDSLELQKLKNKFDIVGTDEELNRALETAVAVAPTDLTVLVCGESGVGKENLPKIIHQSSRRRTGKYLAINCGGIPAGTINAELFGHEKGSFTGAIGERKGYFEEANGGTLFLDEIGELPKETQAMLLRVLQDGEYIKVGSSKVEKTDVRVIAATNVNLSYAVASGKFREDLYYRIAGVQINMPSLRERKGDIYLLFRKFSSDFAEKNGLCRISLSHDAIGVLTSYRWPGNIRQLKNVAEAVTGIESRPLSSASDRLEIDAVTLSKYIPQEKDSLLPAGPAGFQQSGMNESDKQMIIKAIFDLKQEVDRLRAMVEGGERPGQPHDKALPPAKIQDYAFEEPEEQDVQDAQAPAASRSMREANDELMEKVLAKHGGKVKAAAQELGISERTIYRKLAERKKK